LKEEERVDVFGHFRLHSVVERNHHEDAPEDHYDAVDHQP